MDSYTRLDGSALLGCDVIAVLSRLQYTCRLVRLAEKSISILWCSPPWHIYSIPTKYSTERLSLRLSIWTRTTRTSRSKSQ
jgi:hypothetical protein